jgi:hypothetical protein
MESRTSPGKTGSVQPLSGCSTRAIWGLSALGSLPLLNPSFPVFADPGTRQISPCTSLALSRSHAMHWRGYFAMISLSLRLA